MNVLDPIHAEENQEEYVPEDIIFEILTCLPAEFLHSHVRMVCEKWSDLIKTPEFTESHYSRSPTELLNQLWYGLRLRLLKINKDNTIVEREIPNFSGKVMCTCRGIVLFCLSTADFSFCIVNIVTNQILALPFVPDEDPLLFGPYLPSPELVQIQKKYQAQKLYQARYEPHTICSDPIAAAIGYNYPGKEFKVIYLKKAEDKLYYWFFFTVGKDQAWRQVELGISQICAETFTRRSWMSANGVYPAGGRDIIAVDLKDESTMIVNVLDEKNEISRGFFVDESTMIVNVLDEKNEISRGFFVDKKKFTKVSTSRKELTLSLYHLDNFRQSTWNQVYKIQLPLGDHPLLDRAFSFARMDNGELLFSKGLVNVLVGCNLYTGSCQVLHRFPLSVNFHVVTETLVRF